MQRQINVTTCNLYKTDISLHVNIYTLNTCVKMSDNSFNLTYNDENEAENYELWAKYAPSKRKIFDLTMEQFGPISGKAIVDFGCGNGLFLKRCLAEGAAKVVGFDKSSFMINSAKKNNSEKESKSAFVVLDCSSTVIKSAEIFDFAVSHYAVQYSSNMTEFETYLWNMYTALKRGGTAVITMPRMAKNKREQIDAVNVLGLRLPEEKVYGQEPFRFSEYFLKPNLEKGEGFLNENWFNIFEYSWSEETLIKALRNVGFSRVDILDPKIKLNVVDNNINSNKEVSCCCLFAVARK